MRHQDFGAVGKTRCFMSRFVKCLHRSKILPKSIQESLYRATNKLKRILWYVIFLNKQQPWALNSSAIISIPPCQNFLGSSSNIATAKHCQGQPQLMFLFECHVQKKSPHISEGIIWSPKQNHVLLLPYDQFLCAIFPATTHRVGFLCPVLNNRGRRHAGFCSSVLLAVL